MQKLVLLFFVFAFSFTHAQDIDVLHYKYSIELNDENDRISGTAEIQLKFLQPITSFRFDLVMGKYPEKGMTATVRGEGIANIESEKEAIVIVLSAPATVGTVSTFTVSYSGIPKDGLIISRNKFKKRTFFSDNWPDRAHNWIPCVDKPSDKATVEFIVTAPSHYKVISNGVLQEEKELPANKKLTHWKEDIPLPTKIMVIGVADFAVDNTGEVNGIPVSTWVFTENKTEGFYDFAPAKEILAWFIDYIGPYPYKKLANVQSKTIFGGMENANAIFYYENSVDGRQKEESLISHEIVHQWFGDMATEKTFSHLWLSEGFATYLTHIYLEKKYGTDSLAERMKDDRQKIIEFAKESPLPVVDAQTPYMSLLNANSYQKGGWILHMLRRQTGDSVFRKIIRKYYATYAGKNAESRDFQRICEEELGKKMETFFDQWLYMPGYPDLKVKWLYDKKSKSVKLSVEQKQKNVFQFPLEIGLKGASGKSKMQTLQVIKSPQQFSIPVKEKIVNVYLDPKTSLLFEGSVSATK